MSRFNFFSDISDFVAGKNQATIWNEAKVIYPYSGLLILKGLSPKFRLEIN